MVLRKFSIVGALSAAFAVAAAAFRGAAIALERFADRFLALVPRLTRDPLAFEGYHDLAYAGDPLPPAMLNELRHEAGMRTRAAARHI